MAHQHRLVGEGDQFASGIAHSHACGEPLDHAARVEDSGVFFDFNRFQAYAACVGGWQFSKTLGLVIVGQRIDQIFVDAMPNGNGRQRIIAV